MNSTQRILTGIMSSERVLEEDYPVHWDYLYVADGQVIRSDFGNGATVRDLKRDGGYKEIRNCDIAARNLY